jgi:PIN domain nuclease of toxin-antitoxin system
LTNLTNQLDQLGQGHHRDPFDRMLVAQAMVEGVTLVTHDDIFDRYTSLRTLKT